MGAKTKEQFPENFSLKTALHRSQDVCRDAAK